MLDGPDESDPDGSPGVLSEKSPYEPEEFDPDSLGPDVPEAPRPPDGGADSEVAGLFWKLVLVFNVALLGLSVGPMLVFLEGRVDLGIRVFLGGVVAFAYGTYRYYRFRQERDDEDEDGDGGAAEAAADDADTATADGTTDDSAAADETTDDESADHNG